MTLESATFEPTKEHPHDSKTVWSMTVPQQMCNSTSLNANMTTPTPYSLPLAIPRRD